MEIKERIVKLREQMKEKGIDIYIVPTADFHQTEYVGEYFKARKIHHWFFRICRDGSNHKNGGAALGRRQIFYPGSKADRGHDGGSR